MVRIFRIMARNWLKKMSHVRPPLSREGPGTFLLRFLPRCAEVETGSPCREVPGSLDYCHCGELCAHVHGSVVSRPPLCNSPTWARQEQLAAWCPLVLSFCHLHRQSSTTVTEAQESPSRPPICRGGSLWNQSRLIRGTKGERGPGVLG